MGKKPLVGVVGTLCLGLGLAGCECCGQRSSYQGGNGNIRGLVGGTPQGTTPGTQQAWQGQPKSTTPGYATGTTGTTGTTPASSTGAAAPAGTTGGTVTPTGGVGAGLPAVNTGTPVSSSGAGFPMKTVTSDPAVQQTSGTAPSGWDSARTSPVVPLDNVQPKGALPAATTTQRTTDNFGSAGTPVMDAGAMRMPPPPPLTGAKAAAPAAPAADPDPNLMAPPPGVSSIPPMPPLPSVPLPPAK
jgi:hypothetical protein